MAAPHSLTILALGHVPLIAPGADLGRVVGDALDANGWALADGDVVVLAQKIVSKAEGRAVALDRVTPSAEAHALARRCGKDPRLVTLILAETQEVMRACPGVLIVRHRSGLVLANAGIDQSNVDQSGAPVALLLPVDPDATCQSIRAALRARTGKDSAVLVIDSIGRAWRNGTTGTAIGVSGLPALLDLRGAPDLYGRPLQSSELGLADEIAAAASLVMGQGDEGRPIAVLRGLAAPRRDGAAGELVRPRDKDLFP